jgi:serine-type D-Ala-D-Ala carboxypeptidase/endopeptidase
MRADVAGRVGAVLGRSNARHIGLVVGVTADGESAFWHRGRLPDGARSILEIGSITKVFTATLLAELAREGLVSLDDPVQRFLPDDVRMPRHGREITLEDLATHRSGLPALPKGLLVPGLTRERRNPYASLGEAKLKEAIASTSPRREPGKRTAYSNYGMGLLGYVLARRADMSYEQLVRARICEPLDLVDTWIETPSSERARVATGHTWRGRETPHWDLAALAGAGGLRSTAPDLLRFLRLHAPDSDSALEAAARETRRRRASWARTGVGLGWLILPAGRRFPWHRLSFDVVFHEGGTGGFRSFAGVVPETGAATVVLANQARSAGRLGLRVLQALVSQR